jgi:hypothetical protein
MTLKEIEAAHPGFKDYCRDSFTGNECDSDEYGETQPAKGFGYIADWLDGIHPEHLDPEALEAIAAWVRALADDPGSRYGGAEELVPVLQRYFDWLWDQGRHPYSQPHELAQYELAWFLEEQGKG